MSVKLRPFKRRGVVQPGRWEAYFVVKRPNGEVIRDKVLVPADFASKRAASEWAQQRFAHLMSHGKQENDDNENDQAGNDEKLRNETSRRGLHRRQTGFRGGRRGVIRGCGCHRFITSGANGHFCWFY